MQPHFEPMRGEVTGVTTAVLVERHGSIVGRFIVNGYQAIVFAGGVVYSSHRWGDGTWLPWARVPTHSPVRLARHMGAELETA